MLAHDYPWDACQLPLNCFDASFRSFEQRVLPELTRRGIAAIGMKSLSGDARAVKEKAVTAKEALSYTMSLPIATLVSGIDSLRVLRQNLDIARGFRPMSEQQRDRLRRRVAGSAADGRFELYKVSALFEGDEVTAGSRIADAFGGVDALKCRVPKCRVPKCGAEVPKCSVLRRGLACPGHWTLDLGPWTPDRTLDPGPWTRTLDPGPWT